MELTSSLPVCFLPREGGRKVLKLKSEGFAYFKLTKKKKTFLPRETLVYAVKFSPSKLLKCQMPSLHSICKEQSPIRLSQKGKGGLIGSAI